ncbi:MAG: AAA family ATPase [Caldilineaceae bacterium]
MPKPIQATSYTFRNIIEGGFLYVDKTQYLYELVRYPSGTYFVSRPRRFGKSLLLSTLYELFRGNRELFAGLWIDNSDYEWETYPVIRLDFSREPTKSANDLSETINAYLSEVAESYGIDLADGPYYRRFRHLIQKMSLEKQVVILIDEYDKPLIDNLQNLEDARQIRDTLKGFYTVVKAMESHIRLVFITGISKFSKVSIFSELNNLTDLTMNTAFATALGLTEAEIRRYLADRIEAFAQREGISAEAFLANMRSWYNGFCFAPAAENVYNPFSTLLLFYHQRFSNYWFESGTPTFLIDLLRDRNYHIPDLEQLVVKEIDFSTYDIERLDLVPLLFQTGYLTIKDYEQKFAEETIYHLSYPNREVKNAFFAYLLSAFSNIDRTLSRGHLYKLLEALQKRNMDELFLVLRVFFADIPYTLHLDRESYYQSIFFILFRMIGIETEAEVVTNHGRIDAVVEFEDQLFIFEFKLNGNAEAALAQIRQKEYFQKYWLKGKRIFLIGANFDTATRTVSEWLVEEAGG